ncbi:MAG: sugar ABC transporter ATP-binding protein [Lachnospiraceae bacterium]|nr:sugar ABC transporter ATP-binding protein [Lachnospiraceae bacterium]
MSEREDLVLRTEGVCKQFNGIQVLKDVDLKIRRGEIHALMGENGAGKSTIIKIITGVYTMDAGQIYIDEKPVEIKNRHDAAANGISVIYQELSLVPSLTVTENIFLGHEIKKNGIPNRKEMKKQVQALIDKYGFILDPDKLVATMGMAQRQMTEILKALSTDAQVIIMDEPTTALSAAETEQLFVTMEGLRERGKSIIYISHRIEEIYRITDRLTVMRNGEIVGVVDSKTVKPDEITTLMIGRELAKERVRTPKINPDYYLSVENFGYKSLLHDINFKAYSGEILGIGGLVGSGRTELISCIYGNLKGYTGTITLGGKPIGRSARKNIKNGFGMVPEDRRTQGFFGNQSILRNIAIASYDRLSIGGAIVKSKAESRHAEKAIKDYDVRPAIKSLPVQNLSGGNQQKVVIGRWLSRDPQVLLLDEPTAGVDVGVKAELYDYMGKLADQGAIIIMVSSDLAELVNVSDRVLVLHGGTIFAEFPDHTATQQSVLLASSGVTPKEGGEA